jgi:integrase
MPLTDAAVRNAKPRAADYKTSDGEGLYLLVRPNGARLWNLAYRFGGKQKKLSIGAYPLVSLADARDARLAAKKALRDGIDPSVLKKITKANRRMSSENTFRVISDEFIKRCKKDGAKEGTTRKLEWMLSLVMTPLGSVPITDITSPMVYQAVQRIEKRGKLDTAQRLLATISRVFRFGVITARCERDPAAILAGSLTSPTVTHHSAIFDPPKFGALIRAIRSYEGQEATRVALNLLPYVVVRPGEIRWAEPGEFDLEGKTWTLPPDRMKMRRGHVVPLSRQAIEILRPALEDRKDKKLLFPGLRSEKRPISDMTLNAALRRLGFSADEMTAHGFRRTFSTMLNEHGWNRDWIERQLAHKDPNKIRESYNSAEFLEDRTKMMQWWADHVDRLAVDDDGLIG